MKNVTNVVLVLLTIEVGSYIYMASLYGEQNFFVPSLTVILSAIALKISPHKDIKGFFTHLRFGRTLVSLLVPGLIALFGSGLTKPNWPVVPPLLGMFFLTSALVDRMDAKRNGTE